MKKTNAIRKLDQEKISYNLHSYDTGGRHLTGHEVAVAIGIPEDQVFKTLLVQGSKPMVCMIPVNLELDLKKVANEAKEKSVQMLPLKDLFSTTGYVQGGCSPIGMKKEYELFIDESVLLFSSITCSAGQVGLQMTISREDLFRIRRMHVCDLTR